MPCCNVSERVSVTLDAAERVVAFSLAGGCCGCAAQGLSLLPFVVFRTLSDVAACQLTEVIPEFDQMDPLSQEQLSQQLSALKACLAVFRGETAAAADGPLTLSRLSHGEDGTTIEGLFQVATDARKENV